MPSVSGYIPGTSSSYWQVLGAIYLDGGLDRARDVYVRCCPLPESISELLSWEKKTSAYRSAREATREAARQAGLKAAADAAEDA